MAWLYAGLLALKQLFFAILDLGADLAADLVATLVLVLALALVLVVVFFLALVAGVFFRFAAIVPSNFYVTGNPIKIERAPYQNIRASPSSNW